MANLEKKKSAVVEDETIIDGVEGTVLLESDIPQTDDDDDFDWTIPSDDDEAQPDEEDADEQAQADEPEDDADDEEEPEQTAKPQKKLSKEERKINALKQEAKKLQAEKAELQKRLEAKAEADEKEELRKKYIAKGYDEDDAKEKAESDSEILTIKRKLELLEFKDLNNTILSKYPNADLPTVMKAVKSSGLTAEQICRGLYGAEQPIADRRAKDAVLGKLENTKPNNSVSNATRTAERSSPTNLSDSDKKLKARVERMFLGGERLSDEEFVAYKKK